MRVLISGGSGLLGRKVTEKLQASGHEIAWLGRRKPADLPAGVLFFLWNPVSEAMDPEAVGWAEGLINLAGASIGETRWDKAGRELILESRLSSVRTLIRHFSGREPLQTFCGISGAGYYGPGTQKFLESDPAGRDFPAQVAAKWEGSYEAFRLKCRPVHFSIVRMAVVLARQGGALPKIIQPFKMGIGAVLGNGKQPFNWIHLEDAAGVFGFLLLRDGIFNASAPAADTNATMTNVLAGVLKKPLLLPAVPAFVLQLALGDRSSLVLKGNFSDVSALQQAGFRYQFPELQEALEDLAG